MRNYIAKNGRNWSFANLLHRVVVMSAVYCNVSYAVVWYFHATFKCKNGTCA